MNPWDVVLAIVIAIWINGFVVGFREAMFERGKRRFAMWIDFVFGAIIAVLALSRW